MHEEAKRALDLVDKVASYINACPDEEVRLTIWKLIGNNPQRINQNESPPK